MHLTLAYILTSFKANNRSECLTFVLPLELQVVLAKGTCEGTNHDAISICVLDLMCARMMTIVSAAVIIGRIRKGVEKEREKTGQHQATSTDGLALPSLA